MNTEPVASEEQTFPEITPISESPSNIFGAFEQETSSESEVINIPDNAIS
jgi:hypothetical protein